MLKVTCALIVKENRLLLTQNSKDSDHPFKWEFPGGKVKPTESFEAGIQREIKEELDIEVLVLKSLKPVVCDYEIKKIELIPFLCSIKYGDLHLKVHNDFKWIGFNELDSVDLSEADLALIQINGNRKVLKEYIRE